MCKCPCSPLAGLQGPWPGRSRSPRLPSTSGNRSPPGRTQGPCQGLPPTKGGGRMPGAREVASWEGWLELSHRNSKVGSTPRSSKTRCIHYIVDGSLYLTVRDVLKPPFAHTSKVLASKSVILLPGCLEELVFPWQIRKKQIKYNHWNISTFVIVWVGDVFVTST